MTDKPKRAPRTIEDKEKLRSIGRALWRSEAARPPRAKDAAAGTETAADEAPKPAADNEGGWTKDRQKYLARAAKVLRAMEREGLVVTKGPTPAKGIRAAS